MGYKFTEMVFKMRKDATTPTEQAVLVALAFRANDRTKLCFPKQETIISMTHLSRSAVAGALRSLRERGILTWKRGGNKVMRLRTGASVSNHYSLNERLIRNLASGKEDASLAVSGTPPVANASPERAPHAEPSFDDEPRVKHFSPVRRLLADLGYESGTPEYYEARDEFNKKIRQVGVENARQIVMNFERDLRDGELDDYDDHVGLLFSRFNDAIELGEVV